MANIPQVGHARDLLVGNDDYGGWYGPHCTYEIDAARASVTLRSGGYVVAYAGPDGVIVHRSQLTPLIVPYVNRFIRDTGYKIITYRSTRTYRVVVEIAARVAADRPLSLQ
jgi:hypothetical protein